MKPQMIQKKSARMQKKVINLDGVGKENMVELKQTKGEGKTMATYTEEQINQAIERAKEIGVHAAARELSLPWQAVMSAAKKAGVEIAPKVVKPKKGKKTAAPSSPAATAPELAAPEPATPSVEEKKAEKTEEKPVEKPKRGRKKKAVYEVVEPATPAVAEEKAEQSAPERSENELMVENAVLKKENEQLKAKIEKLQKALADLI